MRAGLRILGYGIAVLALVIALAAIYALRFSHFVPSPLGLSLATVAATICGIGGILLAFKPPVQAPQFPQRKWLQTKWLRVPAFAALTFGVGYWAFVAGIPSWYTGLFGTSAERSVTVSRWRTPSRWACSGPDIVEPPMLSTICLDFQSQTLAPVGTTLLLHGRATQFGINVETASAR
jgi:hypothetical protein